MSPRFSVIVLDQSTVAEATARLTERLAGRVGVELLSVQSCNADQYAAALNRCIAQATGHYLVLLDGRLEIHTRYWLEMLLAYLETSDADLLGVADRQRNLRSTPGDGRRTGNREQPHSLPGYYQVQAVVALEAGLLFAQRGMLENYPLLAADCIDWVGSARLDSAPVAQAVDPMTLLARYSLRVGVVYGVRAAVLSGLMYSPQQDDQVAAGQATATGVLAPFQHLSVQQLHCWQHNRDALQVRDPVLIPQLLDIARWQSGWRFGYRPPGRVLGFARDSRAAALIIDQLPDLLPEQHAGAAPVHTRVLLGAGSGRLIDYLLAAGHGNLLVVELDARLMLTLLQHHAWHQAIRQRRLRFLPVAAALPGLDDDAIQLASRQLQALLCRQAGTTEVVRGYSWQLHAAGYQRIETLLSTCLATRQTCATYPRGRAARYDISLVSAPDDWGQSLVAACQVLGVRARWLEAGAGAVRSAGQGWLTALLEQPSTLTLAPDRRVFEQAAAHGLAGLETWLAGKVVAWWWQRPGTESFIDWHHPDLLLPGLAATQAYLRMLPDGSHWLPPAASLQACSASLPGVPGKLPISYVGPSQITILQCALSELAQLLVTVNPNPQAALPSHVLADLLAASKDPWQRWQHWQALEALVQMQVQQLAECLPVAGFRGQTLMLTIRKVLFRHAVIGVLLRRGVPVQVYGDTGWVSGGVVPRHRYRGDLPASRRVALYQASRLNLVPSLPGGEQAIDPQVFEITACGGSVLTGAHPELAELFPAPSPSLQTFSGAAVDLAEQGAALADHVHALLATPPRIDLALAHWVRREHSLTQRARWLVDHYLA